MRTPRERSDTAERRGTHGLVTVFGEAGIERERRAAQVLSCVLTLAYAYAALSVSGGTRLWMDEVLAVSAARSETLSGVWHAILAGTDFSPPTYHLFLHGAVRPFGVDAPMVWRLPSVVALYGTALCVHGLLRRSVKPLAAALGFGMALSLGLFDFGVQARQYAFLSLGFAGAAWAWSGLDEARRPWVAAVATWACLSACLALHFYGVVEVAAIVVAECAYAASRRRFRVLAWAALAATAPVLAATAPLAARLSRFNAGDVTAPDFYGRPTLARLGDALFSTWIGGGQGVIVVAGTLVVAAVASGGWLATSRRDLQGHATATSLRTGRTGSIACVATGLVVLPLLGFALSRFATGNFNERYVATASLLPAIILPLVLAPSVRSERAALVGIGLVACVLFLRAGSDDPVARAVAVLERPREAVPVVVGEGKLYVELMDAVDPTTKSGLVFLRSPPGVVVPDPTNGNEVARMAGIHPDYQVRDQASFLAANPRFYLLSRKGASVDVTTPSLRDRGMLGRPVHVEANVYLYPVQARSR